MAGKWLEEGRTVVDLGADFRLQDAAAYARWYGAEHPAPELLEQAVFALPEMGRDRLRGARLLACPGCYSTAAILALHPAAQSGLVEPDFIVDAATFVWMADHRPQVIGGMWHFGFAPACVWELHAKRGEREVWSREGNSSSRGRGRLD